MLFGELTSLCAMDSVNYFTKTITIVDLFSPPMSPHPQACVHLRNAVEHLHLTDMRFILHPLLISCMRLELLASTSKQLVVPLYQLVSQLFQLVHFLDLLLHGLLEAIS